MATYSPIGNNEVDPESPITSSLMVRLRDNPLAIQEGDPSAPKIVTNAIADAAITGVKLAAECRQFLGTADNGSFLINNALLLNWVKFTNLQVSPLAVNWQTAFSSTVYFCIAGVNFTGDTPQSVQHTVQVDVHDNNGATVRNNSGLVIGCDGYVIAVGI